LRISPGGLGMARIFLVLHFKRKSMKQHFRMFAAYNAWANARLYDAASTLKDEDFQRVVATVPGSLMSVLNHILATDRIWMKRFTGEGDPPASGDAIIQDDFAKLHFLRKTEDARISSWVEDLGEKALTGRFSYMTVSDMRTISHRLAPALANFFNYQTQYRGQAEMMLKVLGMTLDKSDISTFQKTEKGREFA
jgi:uncharacterized damage-inducible protein DinB